MKIGLISYHAERNYGTMLQAYALSAFLRTLGVECEYIDYRNTKKHSIIFRIFRRLVRIFIPAKKSEFDFFNTIDFLETKNAFDDFHKKYIPVSTCIYYIDTIKQTNSLYDKYIVGSDQTWSEYMNRHLFTANFLDFVENDSKKFAYAPSIGTLTISEKFINRLCYSLSSFNLLSCRERSNCLLLSNLIGKDVEYVLDPTFLLSAEDWDLIASKSILPKKKYILAYILGEKECISQYAEKLSKEKKLPVYYILTRPKYLVKENCLKKVGPREFLTLIRDAAYVVTDSFHGTAFCLNFRTQVYCFSKRIENSKGEALDNDRIKLLLSEFGLDYRAKDDGNMDIDNDYDSDEYLKYLECMRSNSIKYLKRIISNEGCLHKS